MKKVLITGVNGLIGNTIFRFLNEDSNFDVYGTVRLSKLIDFPFNVSDNKIFFNIDLKNPESLLPNLIKIKPEVIINCVGITKHLKESEDPLVTIQLNSLLPHKLYQYSEIIGAKFIQISTDCVFSGKDGNYSEVDIPDSNDLYGRSKILGEVINGNALTLRISTIGHEINTNYGLLNWFLNQKGSCNGFKKAFFSGFPTVYFAMILRDHILVNKDLKGLYHLSSLPISKYDLLNIIKRIYKLNLEIIPENDYIIDRSLNSSKFKNETGFQPLDWNSMIELMYKYN